MVRRRELRRVAEPAVDRVELEDQGLVGPFDRQGVDLARRRSAGRLGQRGRHLVGRLDEGRAPLAPHLGDPRDELAHARGPEPALLREVGPGEERAPVRGHDHRQRPAARARQELADGHVDLVHVGPLLAVDLDADERLVQEPRDLRVLERLVRHHVAPVTGRVPDREEDRTVQHARPLEGLVAPGVPVDGLAGVGEQVRTLLVDQPVCRRVVGHARHLVDGSGARRYLGVAHRAVRRRGSPAASARARSALASLSLISSIRSTSRPALAARKRAKSASSSEAAWEPRRRPAACEA